MSAGTSKTSGLTHVIHPDDSVAEMLHVTKNYMLQFSHIEVMFFRYLFRYS